MKFSHLDFLRCLQCRNQLELSQHHYCDVRNETIELGVLTCRHCKAVFPVINGVGVFFPAEVMGYYLNQQERAACQRVGLKFDFLKRMNHVETKELAVARNWSYEWNHVCSYSEGDLSSAGYFSKETFFKFIPIPPRDLAGKTVVLWGVGRGREVYHAVKQKPRLAVAIEMGDEIYGLRSLIGRDENVLIVRCNMLSNPLLDGFAEYSICDHPLHNVSNPALGFRKITEVLKPGGSVAINVYSYEHNFVMIRIVEPLKAITHRFPLAIQKNISLVPAVLLYSVIVIIYRPLQKRFPLGLRKLVPIFDHMMFWAQHKRLFSFCQVTCFDMIHAPISYHFKRQEIEKMAEMQRVTILKLVNTHQTTWSMIGRK
jgi:uncharacterized protein YbaR (Trm112 family)